MDYDLLRRLSEAPGVPGREEGVRDLVVRELEGVVNSLTTDAMGNLIAVKKTKKKKGQRVMLSSRLLPPVAYPSKSVPAWWLMSSSIPT